MKFLMFNVVVIGALAYLAIGPAGGDFFKTDTAVPPPAVSKPRVSKDEIAAKAKEMYDNVYAKRIAEAEKFFSLVDKEIVENETKMTAAAKPRPTVQETALAPKPAPQKKVPILTAAKEVKVVVVRKAPPSAAPVGTGKVIVTDKVTAQKTERAQTPKFMTPRQRARELNRLVRDMEFFFVDKLSD